MLIPYIDKKHLFTLVSQSEIFKRYLHEPNLNSKFTNTLRDDNNPDCSFYFARSSGELRFKDFAYGYNWSCIDVVMIKYNLTYGEAIKRILIDFRLIDNIDYNQVQVQESKILEKKETRLETLIEIKKRRFNQKDIDYWQQYHLEEKDLYYVYPTQHIWLNKSRFYNYRDNDPAYAYGIGNGKYKCYFPLREDYRFIQSGSYIQGERLLPKTNEELLIITKSYKDVLLLKKLGYYAIAPASETSLIDLEKIKEYKNQFDKVILNYDNDNAGKTNSMFHATTYEIKEIFIPDGYPKDITDFVKQEGLDAGIDLMEYLITTNK